MFASLKRDLFGATQVFLIRFIVDLSYVSDSLDLMIKLDIWSKEKSFVRAWVYGDIVRCILVSSSEKSLNFEMLLGLSVDRIVTNWDCFLFADFWLNASWTASLLIDYLMIFYIVLGLKAFYLNKKDGEVSPSLAQNSRLSINGVAGTFFKRFL